MGLGNYILDGHTPVPEGDTLRWAKWFETADRTVRQDFVGHLRVSTVFLGLDHSFGIGGPPLLFETMVFSGGQTVFGIQERYATWEEAEHGHIAVLARVMRAMRDEPSPSESETTNEGEKP